MALVLDTGPILALLDADDPDHTRCAALLDDLTEQLVVVAPTLVEIDYWIRKRLQLQVWTDFVDDIAKGAYRLEHLTADDMMRVAELEARYADLELGMVDASVMAVCERLDERKVASLDDRHFRTVRPKHCPHFDLLPS